MNTKQPTHLLGISKIKEKTAQEKRLDNWIK
jgi:hypothetical protein